VIDQSGLRIDGPTRRRSFESRRLTGRAARHYDRARFAVIVMTCTEP